VSLSQNWAILIGIAATTHFFSFSDFTLYKTFVLGSWLSPGFFAKLKSAELKLKPRRNPDPTPTTWHHVQISLARFCTIFKCSQHLRKKINGKYLRAGKLK